MTTEQLQALKASIDAKKAENFETEKTALLEEAKKLGIDTKEYEGQVAKKLAAPDSKEDGEGKGENHSQKNTSNKELAATVAAAVAAAMKASTTEVKPKEEIKLHG